MKVSTGIDSTRRPIAVGDRVRFRDREYTIAAFAPGRGRWGCAALRFVEDVHTPETPDECSVDRVDRETRS